MSTTSDDLDAVRTVVTALQGFDPKDQERIIRWAREKLGLPSNIETPLPPEQKAPIQESTPPKDTSPQGLVPSIKAFFNAKNPESDTHFAAAVAYYYRFEAPENERKEIITAKDLQEACRQIDRERLKKPGQTLINAKSVPIRPLFIFHPSQGTSAGVALRPQPIKTCTWCCRPSSRRGISLPGKTLPASVTCLTPRLAPDAFSTRI